jgi:hypothetical protein
MSERGIFGLKPDLRLEWRSQGGQYETQKPDHSASLGDSVTPSTRIGFSVHGLAFFDERAGIAEFDGGLSRLSAEARAFAFCVAEWLNRNPARSPPGRCLGCGEAEHAHDALLPFGTEPTGHAWLHSRCWDAWHAGRNAEAVAALSNFGIRDTKASP